MKPELQINYLNLNKNKSDDYKDSNFKFIG